MGELDRKEIVILGGGFAGVYCAKQLIKRLGKQYTFRIALISEENYMVFQPMLPEVAGASLPPRHVVSTLRHLCKGIEIFKGKVREINHGERKIVLDAGPFSSDITLPYEHLVLTLGAEINLSRVPGMTEHAYLMSNVGDAMKLRAAIISRFEEANIMKNSALRQSLLQFVVVGGGYSGVETAGQILDLLHSIHRYYHNVDGDDFKVVLVHSRDHLLPTLSKDLGEYAENIMRERGMEIILNTRVKALTAHTVYLDNGRTLETRTVVCTIGNAPHSLVSQICQQEAIPHNRGKMLTESTLRVPNQSFLWAAGDCAEVPMRGGGNCPATAQFAMRQGRLLGDNLANTLEGAPLRPFNFRGLGELASIGHRTAVANLMGVKLSGFLAWWLWRTIYLMKLPGLDRKLRVMSEWTMDLFFPRDINLLNPRYTRMVKDEYLEPGDILFKPGEPAFSLYIVKEGSMDILDGERLVKRIERGEYFGERALMEDHVWHYTAKANTASQLIALGHEAFRPIIEGSTALRKLFTRSAREYISADEVEQIKHALPNGAATRSIREVMTAEVDALHYKTTLNEAMGLFKTCHHSSYPVVNDDKQVLGMVIRNELYDYIKSHPAPGSTTLESITAASLPTINDHTSVEDALERMLRTGKNKLLVTDDGGRLCGIVTLVDIVGQEQASEET